MCSNIQIGAVARGHGIGQSSNEWWLLKRHEHWASEGIKAGLHNNEQHVQPVTYLAPRKVLLRVVSFAALCIKVLVWDRLKGTVKREYQRTKVSCRNFHCPLNALFTEFT